MSDKIPQTVGECLKWMQDYFEDSDPNILPMRVMAHAICLARQEERERIVRSMQEEEREVPIDLWAEKIE